MTAIPALPPAAPTGRTTWRWFTALLLVLFPLVALRLSWLGDDAFITFRSVENMVAGRGPVWNVDDRVQTFTHPLWFWLLCAARFVTGDIVTTAQLLGIAVSSIAMVWLARITGFGHAAAAALTLCLASRACTSYATSGLETPLVYLLLTALVAAAGTTDRERRLHRVALVCGLLGTTRLDMLVLAGPALFACMRGMPRRTVVRALGTGFLPLVAWSAFATVYYGSPFPITAYAKAFCHGVPAADLAAQGLVYVQRSLFGDPLTPVVIVAGIVAGLLQPGRRALAIGVLLYTAYVVKVGGDYMQGRFLVPPFFLAVAILALRLATARPLAATATMVAACLVTCIPGVPRAAMLRWPDDPVYTPDASGIVEEEIRGQWDHGILSRGRVSSVFGSHGAVLVSEGLDRRMIHVWGSMGWTGFRAGTHVHYVDPWLCDPLIARLPVADPAKWRIGHFYRNIPAGYLESLAAGRNRIPHPGLARLHDAVRSAVRDPIWSAQRWGHLWDLWTGRHSEGLANYVAVQYRNPARTGVMLQHFGEPVPANGWWFAMPSARSAQTGGITVMLPEPTTCKAVTIHVTPGLYEVSFRRRDTEVAREKIFTAHAPERLLAQTVAVPADAGPFDAIWIDAVVLPEMPYTAIVGRVELVR